MNSTPNSTDQSAPVRAWKPLSSIPRRVIGVLVEKAKTTPEQYPMSLNALTTGCNQKNNRQPIMNLTPEQVEQALEELRGIGAVIEIQSGGRVPKYKHGMYEWLGVEKVELAVMAELLLRGEQTLGELRARAARMEPLPDQIALRPVVESLLAKGLMQELTPAGRGQMVSHNLYPERELAELKLRSREFPVDDSDESPGIASPTASVGRTEPVRGGVTLDMFNELQLEVAELRAEVARLRTRLEEVTG
jgi:uncharacterized protein YceH (UPF0502 family)